MTVKELIEALKEMPQEAKVTDERGGYILENVLTEPKELMSGDYVWLEFSVYDIDE